ncbi:MAG: flagellar basal-body rod protein FlgG [Planctomycetaceae bacterium]
MLRGLYSSATGMRAQEMMIDNTANNLANVNTNGFKRSMLDFADLVYTTTTAAGSEIATGQMTPTGLQIGSGVRAVGTNKVFTQGAVQRTDNQLDVAIEGGGFFKVTLPNGEFRYTRDGAFRTDAQGRLVTGDGFLVDGNVTIQDGVDLARVGIGIDGTVTGFVAGAGQTVTQLGQIQLVRFPNPAGLSNEGGNLYSETPASGTEVAGVPGTDGMGLLRQGHLEGSNVAVVSELISLITAQRAYEINAKAIKAGDEMLSTSAQIIR